MPTPWSLRLPALVILSLGAFALFASAVPVYVDLNNGDTESCGDVGNPCATIAYAYQRAVNISADELILLPGTYLRECDNGGLVIDRNLTISGAGPDPSIIDCEGNGPLFIVNYPVFALRSVVIQNVAASGNSSAVLYEPQVVDNSSLPWSLTVQNCSFYNATSELNGGAIHALYHGPAQSVFANIDGCTFEGTSAEQYGGAIHFGLNSSSITTLTLFVTNSRFDTCSSASGGAVSVLVRESSDAIGFLVSVSQNTFHNCHASSDGGAVFLYSLSPEFQCTLNMDKNEFHDCSAGLSGGAVSQWFLNRAAPQSLQVTNSLFSNCSSRTYYGGAILVQLQNSTASTIGIRGSQFLECHTRGDGGALAVYSVNSAENALIEIIESDFENCSARDNGGAIALEFDVLENSTILIQNCTFNNVTAERNTGGAIFIFANSIEECSIRVESCSFLDCSGDFGGALSLACRGNVTLLQYEVVSCEFHRCRSRASGGALYTQIGGLSSRCSYSIISCLFSECVATGGSTAGGAICLIFNDECDERHVALISNHFSLCRAGLVGGAVFIWENGPRCRTCSLRLISSLFDSCRAPAAGAVGLQHAGELYDCRDEITSCSFSNCTARAGGAISAISSASCRNFTFAVFGVQFVRCAAERTGSALQFIFENSSAQINTTEISIASANVVDCVSAADLAAIAIISLKSQDLVCNLDNVAFRGSRGGCDIKYRGAAINPICRIRSCVFDGPRSAAVANLNIEVTGQCNNGSFEVVNSSFIDNNRAFQYRSTSSRDDGNRILLESCTFTNNNNASSDQGLIVVRINNDANNTNATQVDVVDPQREGSRNNGSAPLGTIIGDDGNVPIGPQCPENFTLIDNVCQPIGNVTTTAATLLPPNSTATASTVNFAVKGDAEVKAGGLSKVAVGVVVGVAVAAVMVIMVVVAVLYRRRHRPSPLPLQLPPLQG